MKMTVSPTLSTKRFSNQISIDAETKLALPTGAPQGATRSRMTVIDVGYQGTYEYGEICIDVSRHLGLDTNLSKAYAIVMVELSREN